ncbi:hypothetical protein LTR62_002079 [Meristemomyces frigidus]|uniref:BHLH domain-containing protein n=1 Tax=Meristemomyces frigidus TaxID=1508187 RepID=A0AAN7TMQ9_9PEZI|nr:hypothetical protein LTR62_002079 [Meristemomyces frigidus]
MEAFTYLSRIQCLYPSAPTLTYVGLAKDNLTTLPPFDRHQRSAHHPHDSPLDFGAMNDPYIKSEPHDIGFDPNQFLQYPHQNNYNMQNGNMNVNPANLTGSNTFNVGNSGIADDELLDLNLDHQNGFDMNQGMQNFMQHQMQQQQSNGMYSHTSDGAPIQSPFTNNEFNFNQNQFRPVTVNGQHAQFAGSHSLPQQAGQMRQHHKINVNTSRSPGTAHLAMDDLQQHPGMQQIHRRQQASMGGNGWDSTPSGHSWNESSPFPSPGNGQPVHAAISEVLKTSGHHHKVASSLPAKMENGGFQTQEAKRRRRRESHNAVERRRRDNINERIHDLGTLVPQHRLEDDKVRKHLQTNAPLSPSITNAGMSPPPSSSLLSSSAGRRPTSGNVTQGLPLDDKEKGPNKGDILNGSVAWARDLMWYTHIKLRQEQELKDLLAKLGQPWPFEQSNDEKRMHSEICEILNKHQPAGGFTEYSRAPGSGLRVPGFTNVAGDTVDANGQATGNGFGNQSLSPGFQSGGSGVSSGQMSQQQQHFWTGGELKEEDEWNMEMQ